MKYVLRIESRVRGWRRPEEGSDPLGKYLKAFDPDAYGGQGALLVTRFPLGAKRFDKPGDAVAFWTRTSSRPLTAFLVSIHAVEEGDQ